MESIKKFIERKNDGICYFISSDMYMKTKVKTFNNEFKTFRKTFINKLCRNVC